MPAGWDGIDGGHIRRPATLSASFVQCLKQLESFFKKLGRAQIEISAHISEWNTDSTPEVSGDLGCFKWRNKGFQAGVPNRSPKNAMFLLIRYIDASGLCKWPSQRFVSSAQVLFAMEINTNQGKGAWA